ncbi:SCO family protein [Inquilinus sp. NPDC058860]|uniref:SCO family protein n=1 Tax=Inquilinus sp. NPDC058860 TaxID=3346652 RepID=UPI0036AC6880
MRALTALLGLLLGAAIPAVALAHSLHNVEQRIREQEKYFEPKPGRPAPEFTLQDADGRPVSLADFKGKVVVLHFIYASCTDECPLHADLIARIQEKVDETPMRDRVQFVTITTDPVRDTPEVMKDYGRAHNLDPVNWVFLTSGPARPEETRSLVKRFGHQFREIEGGVEIHGVVTHVIDRGGNFRANFHGLGFDPVNLVVYVDALVNDLHPEPEPSFWDRLRGWF